MDSIRVSEAPDTGSIPVEATFVKNTIQSWERALNIQEIRPPEINLPPFNRN